MQDDLIERLKMHRIILKSGDYNGADLMAAWCDMINAANQGKEDNDRIAALEAKLAEKDAQLAEARAENARLREALRVYAGPMEWTQEGGWGAFPVWADGYPGGVYVDDNTLDYGDAARAALEQGEVK